MRIAGRKSSPSDFDTTFPIQSWDCPLSTWSSSPGSPVLKFVWTSLYTSLIPASFFASLPNPGPCTSCCFCWNHGIRTIQRKTSPQLSHPYSYYFINEQCFKSSQNQHIKSITQNFRDLKNEPIFITQEPTKLKSLKVHTTGILIQ